MKLIFAIISVDDSHLVIKSLVTKKISVTKLSTSGGFLRKKNVTLMIGVDDKKVDEVIGILEEFSKSRKETIPLLNPIENGMCGVANPTTQIVVGGATVFIVDVEKYVKL